MGEKHAPSPVAALADEKPATLMAPLRNVWPEVEKAIRVGHTLVVIHRRLNQMGIPITYRRLAVYRGRIQREKVKRGASAVAALRQRAAALPRQREVTSHLAVSDRASRRKQTYLTKG